MGLVLTRKRNQSIQIGDAIVVTVLQLKGHNVRLDITAPDGTRILRTEIIAAEPIDRSTVDTAPQLKRPTPAATPTESKPKKRRRRGMRGGRGRSQTTEGTPRSA
ncbi:MAG: carbon storage regulator [Blastopirellula sp. JB062]